MARQTTDDSGRSRQRDRRGEILDVATRVFYEKGYDGTTIQDIANELNILKGSLYHYIRSKDDLLVQILEAGHARMLKNLDHVRAHAELPTLSLIAGFVERHVLVHLDNFMAARVFVHDANALPTDARKRIITARDEYESVLRDILQRGVGEGSVCPDLNAKLATKAILTMLNSIHLWYTPGGGLAPADIAAEYTALVVSAVRCDPAIHQPGHRSSFTDIPVGQLGQQSV